MSSLQYQTSVFQDTRISPDVIPDSFTQINKCQDNVNGYADVKQVKHLNIATIFQTYFTRRPISTIMLVSCVLQMVQTPQDSLKKLLVQKFPVPITAEEELMKLAWIVACLPLTLLKFA
jgi:hypothetical protein